MSTITAVIVILVFMAVSAFFSAAETALMASSRAKLHAMEKNGSHGATRVRQLVHKPDKLLSTILLGNTLVNIGSSALATSLLMATFGEAGIAYATIAMTVLILIFSEVLPKTIAAKAPETLAIVFSIPMQIIVWLLKPVTKLIRFVVKGLLIMLGLQDKLTSHFSVDDLRGAIGLGQEHGLLAESERHMLESVLELDKLTVKDLMQHRSRITSLNLNASADELFKQVRESSYSRFPVWEGDRENIVGAILVKDFYIAYAAHLAGKESFNLQSIMQEPYFIPSSALVTNQLLEFRNNRKHMGLVVDEYGDIQGMITMEDILEEIVGEIEDEHDMAHPSTHHEADGSIILTASMPIRSVNKQFNWQLPDDEHVTLGGLVAAKAKGIPDEGTKIQIGSIIFEVITKRKNAILKLRAQVLPLPIKAGKRA